MAFIAVPDCIEFAMRYTQHSQEVVNTLWFNKAGTDPITMADLMAGCAALANWHEVNLAPLQDDGITLNEIAARDYTSQSSYIYVLTADSPGELAGTGQPGNVTAAITFRTGRAGRSFRGRNFIVGLTEGQTEANQLAAGVASDYIDAYTEMNSLMNDENLIHAVVSRYSGGVARGSGIFTAVTAYTMDNDLDSMRTRLTGRGS